MTSTEPSESFQLSIQAAEFYESAFVPAFFAQWAPMLCEAAGVASDHAVLDVACGTGIVARTAAGLVAPGGSVVGLDVNEAMLTVARRVRPDIKWVRLPGRVAACAADLVPGLGVGDLAGRWTSSATGR